MSSAAVALRPAAARHAGGTEERSGRVRAAVAAGCLAAMVVGGAVLALSTAAPHSAVVPVSRHLLPGWITGPLAPVALHLTAARFFIVLAAMTVAYAGLIVTGSEVRARWIVAAVVVLHALFVLTPPLLSTDVFNYVIYARIGALHGLDPYSVSPAHFPHDAVFKYIGWRHTNSAYGPLFTLASYPLALLGPGGALWGFKALAAASSLGCVALVGRIARQLGRPVAPAVVLFGLNPVVLLWTVGGAHNDLLMVLGLLAAVTLVLASREALGGMALVAAIAVKASAGLALPFLVIGSRRRWRTVAGVAALGAVAIAVTLLAFSDRGAGLLLVLRHDQRMVAFDGIPRELARLFGLPGETGPVRTVATVAFVAALGWLLVRAARGADWIVSAGWAFVALLAASSWLLAWYTLWPLALAAPVRDRRLLLATFALQAYYVVNHLPLFLG